MQGGGGLLATGEDAREDGKDGNLCSRETRILVPIGVHSEPGEQLGQTTCSAPAVMPTAKGPC